MASAFVSKSNSGILRSLKNEVTLRSGEKGNIFTALWDTGASNSCISDFVVEQLSLEPTGKARMLTPNGENEVFTYLIDVILPNDVLIPDVKVNGSEIGKQGLGILIGMDIITLGDFLVTNFDGRTVFSFRHPSSYLPDFVAGISARNILMEKKNHNRRSGKKRR